MTDRKPPLPPKQQRSQATLERILDSAERQLASSSVTALDLRTVCADAGLTTGAVYGRFTGKEGLLDALFERFEKRTQVASAEYLLEIERGKYLRELVAVDDFVALIGSVYATSGALITALIEGSYQRPELGRRAAAMMSDAADLLLIALEQQGVRIERGRVAAAAKLAFAWFDQQLFFERIGLPGDRDTSITTLRLALHGVLGSTVVR